MADEIKNEYEDFHKVKRIKTESGNEEVFYPVLYEEIPDEFRECAELQLNETEENKRNGIRNLRKFLDKENIKCSDDNLIVMVLRTCKYNIEKSESKLKYFLKLRQDIAKNIFNIERAKVESILNDMFVCILPYRDKHGRTIVTTRPVFNSELYSIEEGAACSLAVLLFTLCFPLTSICGLCYIGEVKGDSLNTLYQIVKMFTKSINTLLTYPIRFEKIDFVNENFIIRWTLKIFSPFVPEKIFKRISLHGPSYEKITDFYHPDILPYDLEGNLGPLSNKYYKQKFLDFMEDLKNEYRS